MPVSRYLYGIYGILHYGVHAYTKGAGVGRAQEFIYVGRRRVFVASGCVRVYIIKYYYYYYCCRYILFL